MNVNKIENKLKRLGNFYHDNKNNEAFTFKHKRTKEKFVWTRTETYYEFLQRCYNLLNGETVKLREVCSVFEEHEPCSVFNINKTCGNCSFIARE